METDVNILSIQVQEQNFHDATREHILSLLFFLFLAIAAYAIINKYKKRTDLEDLYGGDDSDDAVYRISVGCCTFTLMTSLAAVLLLPLSVISNEVLILYPNTYYVQWLNSRLVQGLWDKVFLFSNLSLFVLLPLAYLFMESAGFTGSKKGIFARIQETLVMFFLLVVMVFSLVWLVSAIFDNDRQSKQTWLNAREFYLPYLYSCISFAGVFLSLLFTPVGFARLFTEVGRSLMKPHFMRDMEEELYTAKFEEESLNRKLLAHLTNGSGELVNGAVDIHRRLGEAKMDRVKIERQRGTSPWRRNLYNPMVMLILLLLTGYTVIMVGMNILELLFDRKALPAESIDEAALGITSLSTFGLVGALIEIVIIFYILFASLAGLYSLPRLSSIRPKYRDTAITKVIYNCAVLLMLSSALPVLCRILGITNFDLLGAFGRQEWLANFQLILLYNVGFEAAATLCLVQKFSDPVRQGLMNKLSLVFSRGKRSASMSDSKYFD